MEFWALAVDRKEYISGLLHSVILLLTWPQKKLKLAMLLFRRFQLPCVFLPFFQVTRVFSTFCIHVCLWILDHLEGILKENSIKLYMTSCNLMQRSSHVGLQFSVGNSLPLNKCREVWVQVWGAVMGMGILRQEKRLHTSPPSSFIRSHLI